MKRLYAVAGLLAVLTFTFRSGASSVLLLSLDEHIRVSDAVFRGTVVGTSTFKGNDGLIYTRTSLRVDEPLKGKCPAVILTVHRGGSVGNEDDFYGLSPRFLFGEEYLLFVFRGPDGHLRCTQGHASAMRLQRAKASGQFLSESESLLEATRRLTGYGKLPGADVTDQVGQSTPAPAVLTGMLSGVASRFIAPDRGEAIPYLIDVDPANLPAGITLTQATNAVQQAFAAWAAVTSLRFKFAGTQSFGQGADTITNLLDNTLRIQLHDNFNSITNPNVLGIGGRGAYSSVRSTGWNIGGNVAGNEFRRTRYGYVVLKSSHSSMQVLSTFTEVLCHEIGHSINMAHSSENPSEPDSTLQQAIMYFQVHADGRGATLGSYDPPIIRQIYPVSNTPPWCFDRVMDLTTSSPQPNVAGINEVQARGYDLQSSNLQMFIADQSGSYGTFTTNNCTIKYTPAINQDVPRVDPADGTYYEVLYARFSDGTNASPYMSVRVISYNEDTLPAGASDGIPDNWMIQYFANANPAVGVNHRATNDFDGDGLNNLNEYRSGMVPTDSASAQRLTINGTTLQWQARPYEVYEIQGNTNLANSNGWTRVGAVMPTNSITSLGTFDYTAAAPAQFFRILKVP